MNKTNGILFVLVFLVIAFLFSLKTENKELKQSKVSPVEIKNIETQKPEDDTLGYFISESYMEGCLEKNDSDAMYDYCLCTFNYLDKNMTNDEFFELGLEIENGNIPPMMNEAINSCL